MAATATPPESEFEKEEEEPSEWKSDIEAQEEHELICLCDNENENETRVCCKLNVGKAFISQWERVIGDARSSMEDLFVVSILGNTASGKSFLVKQLLSSDKKKQQPLVSDDSEESGSTTANVTCFESASIVSTVNTLLLDYEGEKGSDERPMALFRRVASHTWSRERANRRRETVSHHFPKLAYIMSNVIILMSREDFAVSDYMSRCRELAMRATDKLSHIPYRPALILIHNHAPLIKSFDTRKITDGILQRTHKHEAAELRNFFSEIHWVRFPYNIGQMQIKGVTINNTDVFEGQISDLKQRLADICGRHRDRLMTHIQWLMMTKLVLDVVSEGATVMMHTLLRETIAQDNDAENTVILFLFNILYSRMDIHSTRWFHFCRQFAMQALARNTAIRLSRQKQILSEIVIREECELRLNTLWRLLDEYRSCEALYMLQGHAKKRDHPIFCYQHRGDHADHRTAEPVFGGSAFQRLFGLSSRVWWSGQFVSNDTQDENEPSSDIHATFLQDTKHFQQRLTDSDTIYSSFERVLRQYNLTDFATNRPDIPYRSVCCCCCRTQQKQPRSSVFLMKNYGNEPVCSNCVEGMRMCIREDQITVLSHQTLNDNKCVICMDADRQYTFVPCGHYGFCKICAQKMKDDFEVCPLCKQKIVIVQEVRPA